ncbi:MAG TPA: hypothetical protein VFH45_06525, partial [Acidimicrobiales bacterium]|nr:hypothetical protein [Acidimicrobiales bacterium]
MASGWLWRQVQDMGPQPRYETAMDWCAARRRVTLWGGRADRFVDGKQWFHNDTWEWDGQLWVQVEDTGPTGRGGFALCADAGGGLVMFGGLYEPGGDPKAV